MSRKSAYAHASLIEGQYGVPNPSPCPRCITKKLECRVYASGIQSDVKTNKCSECVRFGRTCTPKKQSKKQKTSPPRQPKKIAAKGKPPSPRLPENDADANENVQNPEDAEDETGANHQELQNPGDADDVEELDARDVGRCLPTC